MRKSVCPPEEKNVQVASLAVNDRIKRRISFCGKNSVRYVRSLKKNYYYLLIFN